jgi:hypothetical protein
MRAIFLTITTGILLMSGCTFTSNPATHKEVAEISYEPVRRIPSRFDFIEDRAFPVAEILDDWGLSNNEWELLSLAQLIVEKSDEIGVSPALVLAVIETESTFDICAISRVGAKGLMQVMPARILGRNHVRETYAFKHHTFYDPHWNIDFGMDYLGYLIERFDRLDYALAAYNLGPTRLSYRLRSGRYQETFYVRRIMKRKENYLARLEPKEPISIMQLAEMSKT